MIRPVLSPALVLAGALALLALVVLGGSRARRSDRGAWWGRALMVLLLAAIALRPGIGTAPTSARSPAVEVVVVLDRTTSMSARDWHGHHPRLAGARRDVDELGEVLPGARFTVIGFGRRARTLLPSTSDRGWVADVLSAVRVEQPYEGRGTRVDQPLQLLTKALAEKRQDHPERPRIAVLLTDGENTAPGRLDSFAPAAELVDDGAVLGYGTAAGGPMPLPEGDRAEGPPGWVVDPDTGERARSRLAEGTLRSVAAELGVPYLHRETPGGLGRLASTWQQGAPAAEEGSDQELPAELELVWLLAIPLLVLAVLELRTHWRRVWQARRELA